MTPSSSGHRLESPMAPPRYQYNPLSEDRRQKEKKKKTEEMTDGDEEEKKRERKRRKGKEGKRKEKETIVCPHSILDSPYPPRASQIFQDGLFAQEVSLLFVFLTSYPKPFLLNRLAPFPSLVLLPPFPFLCLEGVCECMSTWQLAEAAGYGLWCIPERFYDPRFRIGTEQVEGSFPLVKLRDVISPLICGLFRCSSFEEG